MVEGEDVEDIVILSQPNPDTRSNLPGIMKNIDDALYAVVPRIAIATRHMESTVSNVRSSLKVSIASFSNLQHLLYLKMKKNTQSQIYDSVIRGGSKDKFGKSLAPPSTCIPYASRHREQDDHLDDNPEGEKNAMNQKSTFGFLSANDSTSSNPTSSSKSKAVHKPRTYASQPPIPTYDDNWFTVHEIDNGVDISKEADTEFLAEIQAWESRQPDIPRQFPEKPAQVFQGCARDPNAPTRYLYNKDLCFLRNGNNEARKYVLSLHKILATSFVEDDLEELLKRWVRKVFTKFHVATRALRKISVINVEAKLEIVKIFLNDKDKELMALLEKAIEERLKYRHQMWEDKCDKDKELMAFHQQRALRKINVINVEAKLEIVKISLNDKDKEVTALLEKEIKEILKCRHQMRRWESFVNGR
nr:hypothetical protein [Tanacetum cinerariifolium]GEW25961.1 hypothetical protein [Tanacetum cinerariifolium]